MTILNYCFETSTMLWILELTYASKKIFSVLKEISVSDEERHNMDIENTQDIFHPE